MQRGDLAHPKIPSEAGCFGHTGKRDFCAETQHSFLNFSNFRSYDSRKIFSGLNLNSFSGSCNHPRPAFHYLYERCPEGDKKELIIYQRKERKRK